MNKDQFAGAWHELKGKVKQEWANLTDDDIQKIDGKVEELSGLLQREYGYNKEKADKEINEFVKRNHPM